MQVAIISIVLTVLGYFFGKGIRKYSTMLYILAIVISLIFSIASFFLFDKIKVMEMFVHGYIGFSLLFIVMFTGALNKKSILSKRLTSIRKEYSIIGFIFIIPHAIKYIIELFNNNSEIYYWIGLIAFVIMIPLFITSFSKIRSKFKYPVWKKLHRWSYLAYTLIFVHVLLVAETRDMIVYIVMFTPYFILKLIKEYKLYKIKNEKANA